MVEMNNSKGNPKKNKRGKNQNEGKNRKLPNVFNKKQILDLFSVISETDIFIACLIALFLN